MRKNGKVDIVMIFIVLSVLACVYLLYTASKATPTPSPSQNLVPSTLITSVTLNTRDRLATTPTAVDTPYYVFKSSGEFYKEGVTGSDGQDTFDLQYGGDYTLLAYNDTTDSGTWLPQEVSFKADSNEGSIKTINMNLYKIANATLADVRDPVDLNGNVSCALGGTADFQVLFKPDRANAAISGPTLYLLSNATGYESDGITVTTAGWEKINCPPTLLTPSNKKYWCFANPAKVVIPSDGLQTIDVNLKFSNSVNPGCVSNNGINVTMGDTFMYRDPNYVTAGKSAFKMGQVGYDQTDIGTADTSTEDFIQLGG